MFVYMCWGTCSVVVPGAFSTRTGTSSPDVRIPTYPYTYRYNAGLPNDSTVFVCAGILVDYSSLMGTR